MRRAGWGWRAALLALAGTSGLLLPVQRGGRRPKSRNRCRSTGRPSKAKSRKAIKTTVPAPAAEPAATGWSAEVSDRAVAATAAEIGGDEARTRFTLVFSSATALPVFHAGRSLSAHHRHAGCELPAAQGLGPAGAWPDPSLSLRPVCARQVADRDRYQGAGTDRAGGHGEPSRGGGTPQLRPRARPTGRASWPSWRRPHPGQRRPAAPIRRTSPRRRPMPSR